VAADDDGVSGPRRTVASVAEADTEPTPPITLQEAAEFVWLEADLLDTQDYAAWLALWTAAGRYVIPIERSGEDYADRLNVVYDDRLMREARVKRLQSGLSTSANPSARTVRTVSRFRALEAAAGVTRLRCAQHLVEYKYDRTRTLAADVSYRLVRTGTGTGTGGGIALDEKVVQLINSDDALFGMGYLL
jgi:3-phenylpropionate/cinnamic acid dioxygenase small subunit